MSKKLTKFEELVFASIITDDEEMETLTNQLFNPPEAPYVNGQYSFNDHEDYMGEVYEKTLGYNPLTYFDKVKIEKVFDKVTTELDLPLTLEDEKQQIIEDTVELINSSKRLYTAVTLYDGINTALEEKGIKIDESKLKEAVNKYLGVAEEDFTVEIDVEWEDDDEDENDDYAYDEEEEDEDDELDSDSDEEMELYSYDE